MIEFYNFLIRKGANFIRKKMTDSAKALQEAEEILIRYCGEFSPFLIEKSKGSYIYTTDGRAILDFTSGQMCSIFGHNNPEIIKAIGIAGKNAFHLLSTMLSPPVMELGKMLTSMLPKGLDKAIFLNTGSESNEVALRMAKLATRRFEIVAFSGSWHGMTAGAQSSTYSKTRRGYGPAIPGSLMLPAPNSYRCPVAHCEGKCDKTCLRVGFELIDQQSVGSYAALIAEPILSAAGIIELETDYVAELRKLCDDRGMYLIFDEAQTGLGRTGVNYAFEGLEVLPDILTLSKTLGGGLPLSATVVSKEIEEECFDQGFIYVTSHVSDPLCATIGIATLNFLSEQKMANKAAKLGSYLKESLKELKNQYECIGDVRGKGLLLGMEIVKNRQTKEPDPDLGDRISDRCLDLGLNMNIVRVKGFGGVFRIAPPLTVSKQEIDLGVSILNQAISECFDRS